MKRIILLGLILGGALELAAQEASVIDITGIGFLIRADSSTSKISYQPLMLRIKSHKTTRVWVVDEAAIRAGFSTYFLDVHEIDSVSVDASLQEISRNQYDQIVLGDRVGSLNLSLTPISGLPGGQGEVVLGGTRYHLLFYRSEISNNLDRWINQLR